MPPKSSPVRIPRWVTVNRWIAFVVVAQFCLVAYFFSLSTLPPTRPHPLLVEDQDTYSTTHNFIVVGILSDMMSADQRQAARETWLRFYKIGLRGRYGVLHKFVIGKPYCIMNHFECDQQTLELEEQLEAEARQYRDILRVEVLDDYNTLSEKVCALVEWAAAQSFDFFLKTDHDIFIRLDTILSELSELGPVDNYWSGFGWHDVPPISDTSDKNRDLLYNLGKFPPYTAGALHILSSNLVRALSSSLTRRYYQNEDQSLGIWLLPFNVTPKHDKRIQQWDVCHNSLIAKHPLSPQRMRDMYSNVINSRDMCEGFPTKRCPLCYECTPEQVHWKTSGLLCDERGASVGEELLKSNMNIPPPSKPLDSVTAGVVGYLPYVSCKRTKLEGEEMEGNFVENGRLNDVKLSGEWIIKGNVETDNVGMKDYAQDPSTGCVRMSASSNGPSYISQVIDIGQQVPEALLFSAWAKADNVEVKSPEEFSLLVTIVYEDGKKEQGFVVTFEGGTHDWHFNTRVFNPVYPVSKIEIYCFIRSFPGTVWFDNISVSKLSDSLCNIKFQSQFFKGFIPRSLVTQPVEEGLKFIIWTTHESTYQLRHRRVLESIFFHHPNAHVKVFSNSLPDYFFYRFQSAGYFVEIVRYDIETLGLGLPGQKWVKRINEWEKGESFFAHVADYLRFVLLFREGGVYTDMDSILVRPIDQTNVIGVEHCDGDNLDYCIHLSQFDAKKRYYLPIGFLVLEPAHPLIYGSLSYFDTRYNPELWPCGTVYLTLAYARIVLSQRNAENAHAQRNTAGDADSVRILARNAFYPIPWQEIEPFFHKDDNELWDKIVKESYAFHLWGQMTIKNQPAQHSLVFRVLSQFNITSPDALYGPL